MYPVFVPFINVFCAMRDLDKQIALDTRHQGCPHCCGPLHSATWKRKPRGCGDDLPDDCCTRLGLCCGTCRKRTLPASVLFCGRHVYLKAVMLLVVAARQRRLSTTSMSRLRALFGVSADTIARWMTVFLDRLPAAPAWLRARGRLSPLVRDEDVPAGLLDLLLAADEHGSHDQSLIRACLLVPGL